MSGSGGFYKYRCKYFYTYNCPNWVWINGVACPACLVSFIPSSLALFILTSSQAEGRDSEGSSPPPGLPMGPIRGVDDPLWDRPSGWWGFHDLG